MSYASESESDGELGVLEEKKHSATSLKSPPSIHRRRNAQVFATTPSSSNPGEFHIVSSFPSGEPFSPVSIRSQLKNAEQELEDVPMESPIETLAIYGASKLGHEKLLRQALAPLIDESELTPMIQRLAPALTVIDAEQRIKEYKFNSTTEVINEQLTRIREIIAQQPNQEISAILDYQLPKTSPTSKEQFHLAYYQFTEIKKIVNNPKKTPVAAEITAITKIINEDSYVIAEQQFTEIKEIIKNAQENCSTIMGKYLEDNPKINGMITKKLNGLQKLHTQDGSPYSLSDAIRHARLDDKLGQLMSFFSDPPAAKQEATRSIEEAFDNITSSSPYRKRQNLQDYDLKTLAKLLITKRVSPDLTNDKAQNLWEIALRAQNDAAIEVLANSLFSIEDKLTSLSCVNFDQNTEKELYNARRHAAFKILLNEISFIDKIIKDKVLSDQQQFLAWGRLLVKIETLCTKNDAIQELLHQTLTYSSFITSSGDKTSGSFSRFQKQLRGKIKSLDHKSTNVVSITNSEINNQSALLQTPTRSPAVSQVDVEDTPIGYTFKTISQGNSETSFQAAIDELAQEEYTKPLGENVQTSQDEPQDERSKINQTVAAMLCAKRRSISRIHLLHILPVIGTILAGIYCLCKAVSRNSTALARIEQSNKKWAGEEKLKNQEQAKTQNLLAVQFALGKKSALAPPEWAPHL